MLLPASLLKQVSVELGNKVIFLLQEDDDCAHSDYYCHKELNQCLSYVLSVEHIKCPPDLHYIYCGESSFLST